MTYKQIPLDHLRFGHEADPPLNPRRVGRSADLETLAASLLAHGQGQAVNVRTIADIHYVIDGNRRLAALRLLAERGKLAVDHPVKADIDDSNDGSELSLALNLERVAMHEADTYVAFRDLHARGLDEKQIASRFGIKPKDVRRMLALGALHEDILDAWREGKVGYETAAAFTLAKSVTHQAEAFRQLKNKQQLYAHAVRDALGANDRRAQQLLTFVDMEVYEAAGGRITKDLFGDKHVITDSDILQRLVGEKLQLELDRLTGDGWSWVSKADDLPDNWNWNYEKLRPDLLPTEAETAEIARLDTIIGDGPDWKHDPDQREASQLRRELKDDIRTRSFTAEHKAASGAVVGIDHESMLTVALGVKKPAASAKKPGKVAPASGISNALMGRLSVQLTKAARAAIASSPHAGLAALLAGHASSPGYRGTPVRVSTAGMGAPSTKRGEFVDTFAAYLAMTDAELVAAAASAVVAALDLTSQSADHPPLAEPGNAVLADALPAEAMSAALREHFDAADYFASASKTIVLQAIGEALNADEARKAGSMKKADLVKFALANVPSTGWLPPELRTAHYAGPQATTAKPARKLRTKKAAAAETVAA